MNYLEAMQIEVTNASNKPTNISLTIFDPYRLVQECIGDKSGANDRVLKKLTIARKCMN